MKTSELLSKFVDDKTILRMAGSIRGRMGGSVKSEAKAAAARRNGKLSKGRPRKKIAVQ